MSELLQEETDDDSDFEINVAIEPPIEEATADTDCDSDAFCFVFLFYLPYLSSIHEKANCVAILWTGSPHSLGSCLFRGLWATCLPHKGGASR